MENTLVLVKPDGVERGLCGEIITRFEKRGLRVVGLKLLILSSEQAERHYQEHVGKPFFERLLYYITSGPIVAMVIRGNEAVKIVRTMMGPTNPVNAPPGTIRGDYATTMERNIVHGSDGIESAEREIKIFFEQNEVFI
ncbi:nucleoside-diphosphate kinase [Dendrosporobacter sp. 1207_IL3150]|uniref:nucleoside-diphosphate kinase n=1 Tax=Dendrosporobacter sp. 1207_IL3150 TaxID=3084054 RepID=UPI002FDAD0E6